MAGLYALAHVLFGLHWLTGGARTLTGDLRFAEALFGAGALLLGMVMRTLNDPVPARYAAAQAQAGMCLLTIAALACSPCIWWFVFRS
jgi:hypothetical protein